jgi:hypothetical protein
MEQQPRSRDSLGSSAVPARQAPNPSFQRQSVSRQSLLVAVTKLRQLLAEAKFLLDIPLRDLSVNFRMSLTVIHGVELA